MIYNSRNGKSEGVLGWHRDTVVVIYYCRWCDIRRCDEYGI